MNRAIGVWTDDQIRRGVYLFTMVAILMLTGGFWVTSGVVGLLSDVRLTDAVREGLLLGLALNVVASVALGTGFTMANIAATWTSPVSFWRPTGGALLAMARTIGEAADSVARWTVVAVLYASAVWIGDKSPGEVEVLRGHYIDPALVIGPVLGLTMWSLIVDYRISGHLTGFVTRPWLERLLEAAVASGMFASVIALTLTIAA
jgi:hypothetical protein